MRQRIIVSLLLICCWQFSFGDQTDNRPVSSSPRKTLPQYINLCSEITDLSIDIEAYKADIKSFNEQIDSLRLRWRTICEDYLSGDVLLKEDLDYLIKNTDPDFDGQELYNRLLAAQPTGKAGNLPRHGTNRNNPLNEGNNPIVVDPKPKEPKDEGSEEIGNNKKDKGLNRTKSKDGNNM